MCSSDLEYCQGGALSDSMPYTEERIREFLSEIVSGLNYCHQQGIIHRDIKPNNIFFRAASKQDIVIGDFGISSLLETEEKVHRTQTYTFLTMDYAAPELLGNNEVSPKTDYYALGMTLIHLYQGRSPFPDMDNRAIAFRHFQGKVPIPSSLSKDFQHVLAGLLTIDSQTRWGYQEVMRWLKGGHVQVTSQKIEPEAGSPRARPYPGYPNAKFPYELARNLERFRAEKDLFRGRISQWVKYFDPYLADRIVEIEEGYSQKPGLGLFKLRLLLDPSCPFIIANKQIHILQDLIDLLMGVASRKIKDQILIKELENALYFERIETWIDVAISDPRSEDFLRQIASLRQRVPNRSVALLG